MLSRLAIGVALSAALASHAAAQSAARTDSARANVLETVTVTAKPLHGNVFSRAWHMNEDRNQVIAMIDENRRLKAQLRAYDKQIVRLEKRLEVVKAEHDRKVSAIAATDSLAADARRRRMELEDRLRRVEGDKVAALP